MRCKDCNTDSKTIQCSTCRNAEQRKTLAAKDEERDRQKGKLARWSK